jgi:hypothetical protein
MRGDSPGTVAQEILSVLEAHPGCPETTAEGVTLIPLPELASWVFPARSPSTNWDWSSGSSRRAILVSASTESGSWAHPTFSFAASERSRMRNTALSHALLFPSVVTRESRRGIVSRHPFLQREVMQESCGYPVVFHASRQPIDAMCCVASVAGLLQAHEPGAASERGTSCSRCLRERREFGLRSARP